MKVVSALLAAALPVLIPVAAKAEVRQWPNGKLVTFFDRSPSRPPDIADARPMPLLKATVAPLSGLDLAIAAEKTRYPGAPKAFPGGDGDGTLTPVSLPVSKVREPENDVVAPPEYGTRGIPYMTARAPAARLAHYRAAGKLTFEKSGQTLECSASLIKPGVVVTAAHCVYDKSNGFYGNFLYFPAYANGQAPYGVWHGAVVNITTRWRNGDSCINGAVCNDDVATITVNADQSKYPGAQTGWFGYGINGFGFNASAQAQITQLGYPGALDNGQLMQRTDSQGFTDPPSLNNTVIGSSQTFGSSGGPWLINFGAGVKLPAGMRHGKGATRNVVVGVTSNGHVYDYVKQNMSSPFTADNIEVLLHGVNGDGSGACDITPSAC